MSDFYFYVTFPNPVTGMQTTVKMYCGDRDAKEYWLDENGNPTYYRDCKVNLIDTGE